jgi:NADPH:quinone reductase
MRAAVYDTSGEQRGVLRVVDRPDPDPGPGEVRVRVHVSGVNPTDWKAREPGVDRPWPEQVPNQDGAGVIDAVGADVSTERVGQRVWVYHAAAGRPTGTAAQFVCLPQEQAVPLPDDVSFDHGAGLGIPTMTAHHCLFADGPVDGRTVLVTGGAGAVGHAAVQLARWHDAHVIATVSSAEKARLAAAAGAHVVLNYRDAGYTEQLAAAAPGGLHRVVDVAVATNLSGYLDCLAPHAVVASYARDRETAEVPIFPLMRLNVRLRFMLVYGLTQPMLDRAVADVTEALRAGALQPLPVHRYPLEEIAAAHDAVRGGAVVGKVLIDLP